MGVGCAALLTGYFIETAAWRSAFVLQTAFFAVMFERTGIPALVVAVGFMLVVFGQIPINDVLIGRVTKSAWRSRAFSVRYIVTFSVSASTLPLIAWIHGSWGFGILFVAMAVAAGAIFAAVMLLPRRGAFIGQPAAAA